MLIAENQTAFSFFTRLNHHKWKLHQTSDQQPAGEDLSEGEETNTQKEVERSEVKTTLCQKY